MYKVLLTGFLIMLVGFCTASGRTKLPDTDDTMLMFVGEDLKVLSIASRREEQANQAPAVARVITHREFQTYGYATLASVLGMSPGFYMAPKEWGHQPYIRGISDSVLFLYDTVPFSSDISKSLHFIDYELSLTPIKRIEIIKGPGSVLWGPDAYAGIVNLVPLTGRDLAASSPYGFESGIMHRSPSRGDGAYLNWGYDTGDWDLFLACSGRQGHEKQTQSNIIHFWGAGQLVPWSERKGEDSSNRSEYGEIMARFAYNDLFTITGRTSHNQKPYTLASDRDDLFWKVIRKSSLNFIKIDSEIKLEHDSALRLSAHHIGLKPEEYVIDRNLKQEENSYYGELIYDRAGIFTAGFSLRKKNIRNAPSWDNYLPDYLGPDNEFFLPDVVESNYQSRLYSVFCQYNHHLNAFHFWGGVRSDFHDEYKDHISLSAGLTWSPSLAWNFKIIGGTAYRTPFAKQLQEEEKELENISNISFEADWSPGESFRINFCGFYNSIDDHIKEDPYAGLSEPNQQKIYGGELEVQISPMEDLLLFTNLTIIANHGREERYKYNDYDFIRPDGTIMQHYIYLDYPYDTGPDTLFNFSAKWTLIEKLVVFARLSYAGSKELSFPRGTEVYSTPGIWLVDGSITLKDIIKQGPDIQLSIENLFDREYEIPGTYHILAGPRFAITALLKFYW